MVHFSEIIGQEHIKEHLQGAIASGMLNHAYILEGDRGSGKKSIAALFAMTLFCEQQGAEPCGKCHSCKQALSGNHPDIRMLIPEKEDLIRVKEIREQLVNDVAIKPYSSEYKIYIIPEAERMNTAAQNALLKTLEEPPSYAIILLLCNNASLLLETIRSRCVMLNIRPLRDEQIKEYLMTNRQVPDYQAKICAAFARGSIGRALTLLQDDLFENMRDETVRMLRQIKAMDYAEIGKAFRTILERQTGVPEFLDFLNLWYRDVLLYKSSRRTDRLMFFEERKTIMAMAEESSYEGIEKILQTITKTSDRLKANVNGNTTLELLLLTIKEN